MIVYSDSWHLKLVTKFFPTYVPKDLCRYFWTVVALLCFTVLKAGIISIELILWKGYVLLTWPIRYLAKYPVKYLVDRNFNRGSTILHYRYLYYYYPDWKTKMEKEREKKIEAGSWMIGVLVIVSSFICIFKIVLGNADFFSTVVPMFSILFVLGIVGFVMSFFLTIDRPVKEKKIQVHKDKGPNLLWEFIKTTKNKVCPFITVKERSDS